MKDGKVRREKMCACGHPLHYSDPKAQELVERQIAELGNCVTVTLLTGRRFHVPRHFIALHEFSANELPALAAQYGFEEVRMR